MKILYFHQHFSTPSGSTGTRPYEMAKSLIAHGHDVTIVCGSYMTGNSGLQVEPVQGIRKGIVDGIEVIELYLPYSNYDSLLKRSWIFFLYAMRSIAPVMQMQYDIIFASSTPLTAGIPGIIASLIRRKPFVFEVRDLWPELPREMKVITNPIVLGAMSLLEWVSYHSATGCIGLSPGIVQGIHRTGVSADKIEMVPNGCDLELFTPWNGEVLRPEGIKKDDFLAVFTGAHGLANGLDAVLDAAKVLKIHGRNDIKLLFIGDGKLKPELVSRANREGLDNCIFLNPVSKYKLTSYLRGADVGLMILANVPAFFYGTSPNKFFDYIATGLPVINNYSGWLAEIIQENNCGIVVEANNPEAFADALEAMANNRDLINQMGLNSRKLAEREFDRKNLGNHFVDFLERMAKK
jgi:glycosyltransferase involved in cell wall biosynthesis